MIRTLALLSLPLVVACETSSTPEDQAVLCDTTDQSWDMTCVSAATFDWGCTPGQGSTCSGGAFTATLTHDTLIAATAMRYQGTLVTRNVREFSRIPGLHWVNWHDPA